MVAATKMRRAQNQALAGRSYSETLEWALARLNTKIDPEVHPLLRPGSGQNTGALLLSTDKALCGALNTNVFRVIQNSDLKSGNVTFYTVGRKGRDFVVRTGKKLEADFENPETILFRQAKQIARLVIETFLEGIVKEFYLVYPNFVSTLRQEPRIEKLLPIEATSLLGDSGSTKLAEPASEFLFEPSADALLDFALTHHIETQIYQALLETKAAEHSARMMAMQNATENAKELVEDLTLTYNQTRQSAITNELLEITTAQAALE